jgi:hypothetical protein
MKSCKKEKENDKSRKRAQWKRGLQEEVYHQTSFSALRREIFTASHCDDRHELNGNKHTPLPPFVTLLSSVA